MSKRKVSVEDKIYAVNLYLDGKESQRCIAAMFDVSLSSVQQWISELESIMDYLQQMNYIKSTIITPKFVNMGGATTMKIKSVEFLVEDPTIG